MAKLFIISIKRKENKRMFRFSDTFVKHIIELVGVIGQLKRNISKSNRDFPQT